MKIKEEQLNKIKSQQEEVSKMLNKVGYLESEKHGVLHELAVLNKEVEDFKAELEKEYGSINIDLIDGSYTKIEKEELVEENV